MKALVDKINTAGKYVGGGIIKVDSFLNHQIDSVLMTEIGREFSEYFSDTHPTMILTAESSGIPPALMTGAEMGIPVVYARKKTPLTMSQEVYFAEAPSRTKGDMTRLIVSPDFLPSDARVLLIDDFLATGLTAVAMIDIIRQSGAELVGIGCVIEKTFEDGRRLIGDVFSGPVHTLAKISLDGDDIRVTS
ncbi:MAG: xanthine phosphoribosyltransferase [Cellvibrionaceae bacterium]|jgi:xanthine phosphoribosyltransferase